MKCTRCGHDSKYRDRNLGRCPKCKGEFAFEPQTGAPVTDTMFSSAIEAVSGHGRIKWGIEHLYYEINRRKRRRLLSGKWAVISVAGAAIIVALLATGKVSFALVGTVLALAVATALATMGLVSLFPHKFAIQNLVRLDRAQFASLWDRWCQVHGSPSTVIRRNPEVDARHRSALAEAAA